MKTKKLLTIAAMACVALNFTSCKDEEFDLSFEKCVSQVDAIKIKDGDTICKRSINLKMPVYTNNKSVEGRSLIKVGTSKENMSVVGATSIELEPFAVYYVEATPYIVHGNDTTFGDTQEIKFYSIPKHDLALTADYGDGEIAANIHWKLQYYYEDEDETVYEATTDNPFEKGFSPYEHKRHKYYECNNLATMINVNLITSYDTVYSKNAMTFPANVDSCYIAQGGTRERPDYPAYIYRYWKDGKTIMHYDPVIYDFCFDVAVPIGESTISVKDTIRGILMDKQNCVCDYEFNIYRIAKIGNKVWTLDDYRGSTRNLNNLMQKKESDLWLQNFCGYDVYIYYPIAAVFGFNTVSGHYTPYIKGYHVAIEDDWKDLLTNLEIEEQLDSLMVCNLDSENCEKILKSDSSMQVYFANSGNIFELFSSYGWTNNDGDFIDAYQGIFNAVPKGGRENINGKLKLQGKVAVFPINAARCYIISLDYSGIAIGGMWFTNGNIRFVKD